MPYYYVYNRKAFIDFISLLSFFILLFYFLNYNKYICIILHWFLCNFFLSHCLCLFVLFLFWYFQWFGYNYNEVCTIEWRILMLYHCFLFISLLVFKQTQKHIYYCKCVFIYYEVWLLLDSYVIFTFNGYIIFIMKCVL